MWRCSVIGVMRGFGRASGSPVGTICYKRTLRNFGISAFDSHSPQHYHTFTNTVCLQSYFKTYFTNIQKLPSHKTMLWVFIKPEQAVELLGDKTKLVSEEKTSKEEVISEVLTNLTLFRFRAWCDIRYHHCQRRLKESQVWRKTAKYCGSWAITWTPVLAYGRE